LCFYGAGAAETILSVVPPRSALGQNAKYPERADDFRLAPMNGHHQASILVTSGARLATVFEQRQPDILEDSMRPVKAHGVGLLV